MSGAIDGLLEHDYQRRFEAAKSLRRMGGNFLDHHSMMSIILDMASRPATPNPEFNAALDAESARDYWDIGDWMEFLHGTFYKPGWKMELRDEVIGIRVMSLTLTVYPDLPFGRSDKLASRVMVTMEHVRDEKYAQHLVEGMIRQTEDSITQAWLSFRG